MHSTLEKVNMHFFFAFENAKHSSHDQWVLGTTNSCRLFLQPQVYTMVQTFSYGVCEL